MKELINITNQNGNLVVSSREVAENFEKRHDHVMRDINELIKNMGSPQNWGHLFIESSYRHEQNNQIYREYLLTRDGFTLLAMGFTGQRALNWKLKYIEAFNKMEQQLKEQSIPKQIDSKFLYQIAQQLEEKERQIEEMKPKALFADAWEVSKKSILVGEMAKLLARNGIEDMGQNRFFKWLRDNGYLHKSGEQYNLPTQYSIDLELFEVKTTTINNPDGSVRVTKTPKVTVKGQTYFIKKFKERIA